MTATSEPTPSQTVGPFFAFGLPFSGGGDVVAPGTAGAISLHGTVRDGAGVPVPDALLEFWQAGPDGQLPTRGGSMARDGRTFTGFARVPTDRAGDYAVRTLRPAAVVGTSEAPHLAVTVFARGLLHHLFTRVYFPNHTEANAADPLLASLPPERAATLLAVPDGWFGGPGYRFDVRLQGPGETVFLDFLGDGAERSSTSAGRGEGA
ncbi:protocatechuate 3,4-dioxygenase subunit alpha [Actinomycetospora sp. TBRC 11914]|uniref:protocatechuate 3,4-dioxygenase subunit alpha n=1 Tax=Actinomycetospora sp. TBRC 11914 TaxID=2729387 RepID=UPI00145DBB8A|nr:protocatechuate 3,4-dioxygenase subunit alpha [Actinomycetospora sp. TBRC 11914]NMO89180.1 protocatechuate 3,4-dioxygenase subunit alpha [Actinomycetospora sp. TBRC 11914]